MDIVSDNFNNIDVKEKDIYPSEIYIKRDVKNNCYDSENQIMIIDGADAIDLKIAIKNSHLKKEDIKKELSDIFQIILEYFS